jgi:hypothetical protein
MREQQQEVHAFPTEVLLAAALAPGIRVVVKVDLRDQCRYPEPETPVAPLVGVED